MSNLSVTDGAAVRIHYDVVGKGRPLVMLHGGAAEASTWRDAGYVDALKDRFRLILVDQRGAGRSDKPHSVEAHALDRYVSDVVTILDELRVETFLAWGWSYGADVAVQLALRMPDRVEALVLTGNPLAPGGDEGDIWWEGILESMRESGMEPIRRLAEGREPIPAWRRQQILDTDADAFIALAVARSRDMPGYPDATLRAISTPTLLIVGEKEDSVQWLTRAERLMPAATAVALPGVDHEGAFLRSDLAVREFRRFLAQSLHALDDASRTRVAERLGAVRSADERLAHSLDMAVSTTASIPETAIDREPIQAVEAAIAAMRAPLPTELQELSDAARSSSRSAGGRDARPRSTEPASKAIENAYAFTGDASGAAAALFTTGRLMFVGDVCDFAVERMKTYAKLTKALNTLLPQVVAWELREQGLACHCVCPMCGIGACGCIWASLHNIDVAWGGPGFAGPDDRGIPLRSPPRPGSEMAKVGAQQWDRIVSVDGETVRWPGELQQALRRHSLGEEVRLRLERDGESREVVVRHVSTLP